MRSSTQARRCLFRAEGGGQVVAGAGFWRAGGRRVGGRPGALVLTIVSACGLNLGYLHPASSHRCRGGRRTPLSVGCQRERESSSVLEEKRAPMLERLREVLVTEERACLSLHPLEEIVLVVLDSRVELFAQLG
jgi:hypothetical protein